MPAILPAYEVDGEHGAVEQQGTVVGHIRPSRMTDVSGQPLWNNGSLDPDEDAFTDPIYLPAFSALQVFLRFTGPVGQSVTWDVRYLDPDAPDPVSGLLFAVTLGTFGPALAWRRFEIGGNNGAGMTFPEYPFIYLAFHALGVDPFNGVTGHSGQVVLSTLCQGA